MEWIDVNDRLPELIEGQDYSENVLAIEAKHTGVQVFCLCFIPDPETEKWHYVWANCYQNIDGDAEFDDNYKITHWMPLPKLPNQ